MRLAVGLSGGADSVALLRALAGAQQRNWAWCCTQRTCITGCAATEADGDLEFCRELGRETGPALS